MRAHCCGGNPTANHTIAICLCTTLHWLGHSAWLGAVPVRDTNLPFAWSQRLGAVPVLVHQFTICLVTAAGCSPSAGAQIFHSLCHSGWVQSQGWCTNLPLAWSQRLSEVPVLVHEFTTSFVAAAGCTPSAGAPIYRLLGHSGWMHSQCSTLIANCQQYSMVNYARERGLRLTLKVDVRSANMGLQYGG